MGLAISLESDIGDELARQIERRTRILGETTAQACVGIAMQTLRSLRAATPKSKGKLRPVAERIDDAELGIAVEEAKEYVVGFHMVGGERKPCLRVGNCRGAVANNVKPWWRVNVNREMYAAKVYRVTLSKGRAEAWKRQKPVWYMVAKSLDAAKAHVTKRYQRLVTRYSNLGRGTWTRAMSLVADRGQKSDLTQKAGAAAVRSVSVAKDVTGFSSGNVTVTVSNFLPYISKIVGETFVRNALMKALNSTNGIVNSWIKKHDAKRWFNEISEKPFPKEVFQ